MGLQLITGPASEPITLSEAKAYARVDTSADDMVLNDLIGGMRSLFERSTGLILMHQTWELVFDYWPMQSVGRRIATFPLRPISSVSSVVVDGGAVSETTFPSSDYSVDSSVFPPRLIEAEGAQWPAPQLSYGGIKINFQAGFGASAASVPSDIKMVLLCMVSEAYERRGETSPSALVPGLDTMLKPFREPRL